MCGVVLHFKLLRNKALYWGGGGVEGGVRCCRPQGEAETPIEKDGGTRLTLCLEKRFWNLMRMFSL